MLMWKPSLLSSERRSGKRKKKDHINNYNNKQIAYVLVALLVSFVILTLFILSVLSLTANATAIVDNNNNSIKMTKQESFRDSNGRLNIIGVVDNNGNIPVSITIGLNVIDKKNNA